MALTADGQVELGDGQGARLAGIRMRSVEETGEPDALELLPELVGGRIDIEPLPDSDSCLVYYPKEVWYWCPTCFMLPHPRTVLHFVPKYERGCLNRLLIQTGLARYDASAFALTPDLAEEFSESQQSYDRAVQENTASTPLESFRHRKYLLGVRVCPGDARLSPEARVRADDFTETRPAFDVAYPP